jgi:uncharacterized membrane protein
MQHTQANLFAREGTLRDSIWAPAVTGALAVVVGIAALAVGRPLLFPSLGPTMYLQSEAPFHPTARFYNTVVGHFVGFVVASLLVLLLGATQYPSVFETHVPSPARVIVAILALVVTLLLTILLRASHPPVAATALLVAFGGFNPTLGDATTFAAGVLLTALVGEGLRRVRLAQGATHSP